MAPTRDPRESVYDRALAKVRAAFGQPEVLAEESAETAPDLPFVDADCAVQIFGRRLCSWSSRAVTLVQRAGLPHAYTELGGGDGAAMYRRLRAETGQYTVPFVFVRGRFIGGFDQLQELHRRGELESWIAQR